MAAAEPQSVEPARNAAAPVASHAPEPDDFSAMLDGIGAPSPATVPDDVTVPGFGRAAQAASSAPAAPVDAAALASAAMTPPKSTIFRSPDGALTVLAADEGAHDPRCRAASVAHAVAAAMSPGEFSGGMQRLRERLLARHAALHASSEDLIDPVMEEASVIALHTTGRWAALLRLGAGEVWQWRRGQMRPVFAQASGSGQDVDAQPFSSGDPTAVGLGGNGTPQCDDMVCAVEPGDRFVLLATRRLVGLDHAVIAQALTLPSGDEARAHIARACALGSDPSPWPVAVVEITS